MRKSILFVPFILLFTLTVHAQIFNIDLEKGVIRTAKQAQEKHASNAGALERNITATFSLLGGDLERHYVTKNNAKEDDTVNHITSTSSVSCKAYALDTHWLILAGTCMEAIQQSLHPQWHNTYRGDKDAFEIQLKEGLSERTVGLITEKGLLPDVKNHLAYNDRVMLVWHDKEAYRAPFVNVLAVASPYGLQALQNQKHTLKIHTARFGSNKTVARSIQQGTISENTFALLEHWYDLPGTYTDPLFAVNPAGSEFLTGYNTAVQFIQTAGKRWYSLTYADLLFIKNTVQQNRPQDWPRLKDRLFYNDTACPYFH